MPKRREPELTPKEQFRRFVETAREHEVDETGKEFERAFEKLVKPEKPDQKEHRSERSKTSRS